MDVNVLLLHSQYALPVGVVLVCAVLVFVFGFKKAEQPPFAQLSDADRKQAAKKRTKTREKRNVNGHVGNEKASPAKKTSPVNTEGSKKSTKTEDEGKTEKKHDENKKNKNQDNRKGKENKVEQTKNKKNLKNLQYEKPVDFDDGDWEQAYSRKDKKNKKKEEESAVPISKSKKSAKKVDLISEDVKGPKDNVAKDICNELLNLSNKEKAEDKVDTMKIEIKDKVAKDTQNKELKEKNEMVVILNRLSNDILEKAQNKQPSKVVTKEEKSTKSKKGKKVSESASVPSDVVTSNDDEVKTSVEKTVTEVETQAKEVVNVEKIEERNSAAFDELGDTWTEAKPQRKSKKRTRKDN